MTSEPPAPPPGSATRDYRRDSLAPFTPLVTDGSLNLPPAAPPSPGRPWLNWIGIGAAVWLFASLVALALVALWVLLGVGLAG